MPAQLPEMRLATMALTLLLLAACGREQRLPVADTFPFYSHPDLDEIRRLLVLPAWPGTASERQSQQIDQAIATAWRECGRFEVVQATDATRDAVFTTDALAAGTIDSQALRRLASEYRAEAVLLTRLEHVHSYDPVAIGLQACIIDCGYGTTLWSGTGHWDAGRADIQADIRSWHRATIGTGNSNLSGWRTTLQSPRLFARYVADRLAATVAKPPAARWHIEAQF